MLAVSCGQRLAKFENLEKGLAWLGFMIHIHMCCCIMLKKVNSCEFFSTGFVELAADLVEASVAHCQLIVMSKKVFSDIFRNLTLLCTKTWNNFVLQFMKVSDMLEANAGFLVR